MWNIEKIINFGESGQFQEGYARFGFHADDGTLYVVANDFHWVGEVESEHRFCWIAGKQPEHDAGFLFDVTVREPTYVAREADGSVLVTGDAGVVRLHPDTGTATLLIDREREGISSIGNAIPGVDGSIWINDVCGYKLHRYRPDGTLMEIVGKGVPGFDTGDVPFAKASFEWIYDIRQGADGNIYVLDSRNYAVRMLDLAGRTVRRIAGTGEPGYTGDGGNPLEATFGGSSDDDFDGPWSLSVSESNEIFVGDTHNHVIRLIDRQRTAIRTIAGNPDVEPGRQNDPGERDPGRLNLPRICGLDYHRGRLFIPEWDGDLVVLARNA